MTLKTEQSPSQEWSLYLIKTAKGMLYTGITTDVTRRLAEHKDSGVKAAKFLKGKGPLTLMFQQVIGSKSQALKAEYAVKRLSKQQKQRIIHAQTLPSKIADI